MAADMDAGVVTDADMDADADTGMAAVATRIIMTDIKNEILQFFLCAWVPGAVPNWSSYLGIFQQFNEKDIESCKKIAAHIANEAQKIVKAGEKDFNLTLFYVGVLNVLCHIRFDPLHSKFGPWWGQELKDYIGCGNCAILTKSRMKGCIQKDAYDIFSKVLTPTISCLTNSKKTKEEVQAAIEKFGETPHVVISL